MGRIITYTKTGRLEKDTLHLVQAFMISRIIYVVPYLKIKELDLTIANIMIRKAYTQALGIPASISTKRLLVPGSTTQLANESMLI